MQAVQAYLEDVWGQAGARFRLLAENTPTRRLAGARRHVVDNRGPAMSVQTDDGSGPLTIELELGCPAEHAFTVWTTRISAWWPGDHTVSGDPEEVVLQGHVGGRIFERTAEGVEHDWGRVTAWEPPTRLAYTWHIGSAPDAATEVEIRFRPHGDEASRIEITHRGWERLGPPRPAATRTGAAGPPCCRASAPRRRTDTVMSAGTKSDPWALTTAPGTSSYTMYRDDDSDRPCWCARSDPRR